MNLYNRIEKLCFDRGINITDMCKESGASRGSLGDLKSGKKKILSVETLLKISNYFGITINELISTGKNRIYEARRYSRREKLEIAKLLNIDISVYNHYENTCNAPLDILEAMSEILNIDVDFIIGTEYVLNHPVSSWTREMKEDYNDAPDWQKTLMEYEHGDLRYLKSNVSPLSTNDDYEKELLRLFRLCNISDRLNIISQLNVMVHQEEEKKNAPSTTKNA